MIARLRGEIVSRGPAAVVVDVQGIGWEVRVSARAAQTLQGDVTLHVLTVVTENLVALYGFETVAEKECFELLRGIEGLGAATALAALNALTPDTIAAAVNAGDKRTLCTIPRVGPKIADRMVLELKGKMAFAPAIAASPRIHADDPLILALAQLGFRKSEIDTALAQVPSDGETGGRLAAALKVLR